MIRLHCKAQTYHWGKKGLDTLVGKCYLASVPGLPESAELYDEANNEHYAELWIGDHPNGPAEIIVTDEPQLTHLVADAEFMKHYHHKDVEIGTLFKHNPEKYLGKHYVEHFGAINPKLKTQMAFLFKLLAVDKALSIQAHPHKSLAEKLHQNNPDIYKDDNHKPEIEIALSDDFSACFGFLNPEGLKNNFKQNRVIAEVLNYNEDTAIDGELLKKCVHRMFFELDKEQDKLEVIINKLSEDILAVAEGERSIHQKLFLTLKEQYGSRDVGLLFNIMTMNRGEAVVITPTAPHAYLTGDLVECMANSDNVVRGGLTPKFKDTETLFNMLPYDTLTTERYPIKGKQLHSTEGGEIVDYVTGFEEFKVTKVELTAPGEIDISFKTFAMAIVVQGQGSVTVSEFSSDDSLNTFKIEQYCAYYMMPEKTFKFKSTAEASPLTVFIASCDI